MFDPLLQNILMAPSHEDNSFPFKKEWLRVARHESSCAFAREGLTSTACSPILSSLTLGLLRRTINLTLRNARCHPRPLISETNSNVIKSQDWTLHSSGTSNAQFLGGLENDVLAWSNQNFENLKI